jgi:DNA-binding winged helix-turn-helix (wHTH) protein
VSQPVRTMPTARFAAFQLDVKAGALRKGTKRIRLQNQPFQILLLLLENPGELITREQIQEKLWTADTVVEFEHSIGTALKKLRQALGDDASNPRYIETLSRRGYRWLVPVTWEESSAGATGMALESLEPVAESRESAAPPVVRNIPEHAPLVGRRGDLDRLKAALQQMLSGHRQIVFISGDSGIGKTALVDEFARQAEQSVPGLLIARGQCVEGYGGKESYYVVLEAVGQLCSARDSEAVVEALAARAPTWLVQFPALLTQAHRETLQREILGATRERMLREIGDALESITAASPLLLILEDLHWADPSTVDLLSALARRRNSARVMLLATNRSLDAEASEHPLRALKADLQVHQLCEILSISPLNESQVGEFLAADAAEAAVPKGLAALVHRHSGGNPLFMAAAVDHLRERGLISRELGRWKLNVPLDKIEVGVPQRLRRMIEAQIERLSKEQQRALEVASIAGVVFDTSVSAGAAEMTPEDFEDLCEKLSRRNHMVRWVGSHRLPDGAVSLRYEFVHALYREVYYHRQAMSRRVKLQLRIAEHLEALYSGPAGEVAAAKLAYHFEEAGDWARAVKYLLVAAATAGHRFEPSRAATILEHARELVSKIPEPERARPEIEVLQKLSAIYSSTFDQRAFEVLEVVAERAVHHGLIDVEVLALVDMALPASQFAGLDEYLKVLGRVDATINRSREQDPLKLEAWRALYLGRRMGAGIWDPGDMETCQSVVRKLRQAGARQLLGEVQFGLCWSLFNFSQYHETLRAADEGIAIMLEGGEDNPYLTWYFQSNIHLTILCNIYIGNWGEALRWHNQRVEMVEKNGDQFGTVAAAVTQALLRIFAQDFIGGREILEPALSVVAGIPVIHRHCLIWAGWTEAALGNPERALEYLLECRRQLDQLPMMTDWTQRTPLQLALTEAWLSKGDLQNARVEAELCLRVTLATEEHTWRGLAYEVNARLAIAEQDLARAQDFLAKAIQAMEDFEVPLAHWRVHATAFELHKLLGNHELAVNHRNLSRATILKLADSLSAEEPLRHTFLSSPLARRVLD